MIALGNRKRSRALLILLLIALLVGCSSKQENASQTLDKAVAPEFTDQYTSNQGQNGYGQLEEKSSSYDRKIIKSADIEQKATDLDAAMGQVQKLVDLTKGFIQSSSMKEYSDSDRVANYVLRVPEGDYSHFVTELQSIGKNTAITESGEDVTEEYYDNESRVKNLKLQEAAVQRLYDKAEKMEDILKIQQELFRIRGEIEQLEGRNRYLDNLSNMATINLTIREVKPVDYVNENESVWKRASEGFMDSIQGVYTFLVNLLVFLISALPVLILLVLPVGLIVWGIRKLTKQKWFKRGTKNPNDHEENHQ